MLTLRSGQWWLEDRGSSNGTRLNGYRVEEPIVLSAGDIIGIGQLELKLELEE
jgi:pSer/pThr/pTyr-binding forkhead associated (FHA) protein